MSPISGGGAYPNVDPPFSVLLLKHARKTYDPANLRKLWDLRARYETISMENWMAQTNGQDKKKSRDKAEASREKFFSERLPQLQWQKEVDLYRLGDQRNASENLLKLIKHYEYSPFAKNWESQFRNLIVKDTGAPKSESQEGGENEDDEG